MQESNSMKNEKDAIWNEKVKEDKNSVEHNWLDKQEKK